VSHVASCGKTSGVAAKQVREKERTAKPLTALPSPLQQWQPVWTIDGGQVSVQPTALQPAKQERRQDLSFVFPTPPAAPSKWRLDRWARVSRWRVSFSVFFFIWELLSSRRHSIK
jgi:hypothetical protein